VLGKFKSFLVRSYYGLKYPKARDLRKKGIPFEHYRELNRHWLAEAGIKTVLDIGANQGQFAKLAREVFPGAVIHSFEPLPDCYEALQKALPGDNNFSCYNKAVGRAVSELEFFRSVHSPSSSFLQMEDAHKQAFPESSAGQVKEPIRVKVDTLDAIFGQNIPPKNILLKIDVQGFENEVLAGGRNFLKEVKVVIIEMSLVKLYKDQPLFHDVYMRMYENGFRYHGNMAQMMDPKTHEVVQLDAIFTRDN
jgi:FkbM family methyltransferase